MKVTIKSAEEIEKMRRAGEILAAVHQNLAREIKPGMSTLDIDRLGEEMIRGYVFLHLKIIADIRRPFVFR